jgi:hypothetical protein
MEVQPMFSYKTRIPAPATPSLRNQLIISIGRHAFVHLPPSGEMHGDFTPFALKPGSSAWKGPRDGQEVEIIAWRPMAPQGLCYQVRCLSDQREWWARATCLRMSTADVN